MQIKNRSGKSIEIRELDWAPGQWDAYLVPWPHGGERLFVDTCPSKTEATSAAKAALQEADSSAIRRVGGKVSTTGGKLDATTKAS